MTTEPDPTTPNSTSASADDQPDRDPDGTRPRTLKDYLVFDPDLIEEDIFLSKQY